MEKLCDLHAHSYYSDGSLSPAELLEEARRAGLSAVVLSDHNTVAGLKEFTAYQCPGVEAVPGVEFSTEYKGSDVHILGLFVLPENYGAVNEILEAYLQRKEQSNIALVQALCDAGMPLCYETIRAENAGSINRAVIGRAMVEKGYCRSVQEAFDRYFMPGQGFFVPPLRPDPYETIRFIKSIGCTAVLAHPFLSLDEQELHTFLVEAKKAGLDAMEVYYAKYDEATTQKARALAREFDLLESGGSDFHGAAKPDIALGTGRGDLKIPLALLEKLRTRSSNGQKTVKTNNNENK